MRPFTLLRSSRQITRYRAGLEPAFSHNVTLASRTVAMLSSSKNTFDPNTDVPDLSGRVFVVTGGSAGIGYGICAHLLQHNPAKLYLLGKKQEHLDEAQEGLAKYGEVQDRVSFVQVELEDLHDTDRVAKRLASDLQSSDGGRLDALLLNAGLGVGKYSETHDGLDSHMQVNVWSQFHLAMTLLPFLLDTPNSRLCFQSSDFHRINTSGVDFRSVAEMNTDIGASALYNRTKLAQILLAQALVRRKARGELGMSPGKAPWINATHPGPVSTDQPEQAVEAYGVLGKVGVTLVRPFMKEPIDDGCRSMLFASTSSQIIDKHVDGAYIVPDCKIVEPSKQSQDEALQERCWDLTVDVLKGKMGDLPYLSTIAK